MQSSRDCIEVKICRSGQYQILCGLRMHILRTYLATGTDVDGPKIGYCR